MSINRQFRYGAVHDSGDFVRFVRIPSLVFKMETDKHGGPQECGAEAKRDETKEIWRKCDLKCSFSN